MSDTPVRKIIQIAGEPTTERLIALCDDGSLWAWAWCAADNDTTGIKGSLSKYEHRWRRVDTSTVENES